MINFFGIKTRFKNEPYRSYMPSRATKKTNEEQTNSSNLWPLLVVLHGCDQDAAAFEHGSRMNEQAERAGFVVLYINQKPGRNLFNCWRWFDPKNRNRGSGELAEIIEIVDRFAATNELNPKEFYVAGISSGGATAAALLTRYPEYFAGACLHSSPALDVADNQLTATYVQKFGPVEIPEAVGKFAQQMSEVPLVASIPGMKSVLENSLHHATDLPQTQAKTGRRQRVVVIHGDKDKVVNPRHADRLIAQLVGEKRNREHRKLALDQIGQLKTNVTFFPASAAFGAGCLIRVADMQHAWAGGFRQKYFEPRAFSACEFIAEFLILGREPFIETVKSEESFAN